jgi:branched-chain amino acid transport system ATP-binding protein
MRAAMLLKLCNVDVHYGRAAALHQINLAIAPGSIVAIVGANGAGKTTILRAISGLKKITTGEIWFQDTRIDHLPPHRIVGLGIAHIPEGRMVFTPMTVEDNLRAGAFLQRDESQVARDLEAMYAHFPILKDKRKQLAGNLSGGQQQMVAVARALMARPQLVLMDEPSVGLAPKLVAEVGRMIHEINQRGISVILVEQNARMALKLAHYAYVLQVGAIILEGEARQIAEDERVKKAYLGE